jgi:hypothetical protein
MKTATYQSDFHAWAFDQAKRLRAGKSVDIENIAEELETLGRSERRELVNNLAVLIQHMLKLEVQRHKESRSWMLTVEEHRKRVNTLLRENPSLKSNLESSINEAYALAVILAAKDTGIDVSAFPEECQYSRGEIFGSNPLPKRVQPKKK